MNVLILCHANRWRSALVHGYLEHLQAMGRGHPTLGFASAGFKEAGRPAGKPIRDAALELGFSLEDHRSEVISPEHVSNADMIIHMGPGNEKRLRSFLWTNGMDHSFYMSKAYCLGLWCEPRRNNIQDFAFLKRGSLEFDTVLRYTISACNKLMTEVIVPDATKEQAKARFVTEEKETQ